MSSVDLFAHALDAMNKVLDIIRAAPKTERSGQGSFECPACKGTLRYAWSRQPGSRSRLKQSYTAVCDTTPGCVRFSGH